MPTRVRYAPSPTGIPHVGNIRTALFNWLLARHDGGQFIVRVEDTDRARYDARALDGILESLRWLGLNWDEGPDIGGPNAPYFQSERLESYHAAARQLIDGGHAYECFCSPERLDQVRKEQQQRKEPPRYDRLCRDLSDADREAKHAEGVTPVVRFRTPLGGTTVVPDAIRGEIAFENATLDDFVLLKSDGYPTYQLGAIVDDNEMQITHVLRGDEWISSAPRNLLTYQAFGWEPPVFAHLPVILGADRSKLSKRHGAMSALDYRDQGYLPEAMFNFLGLLGWSLDDHTVVISREQFVANFTLERVGANPAMFDREKLDWMNGVYIREHVSEERLVELIAERLERDLPPSALPIDRDTVAKLAPLIRERMKTLAEATEMIEGFFVDELPYSAADLLGKRFRDNSAGAAAALREAKARLEGATAWDHDALESDMRALAGELELKAGDLFMLLRVACTGKPVSPPLFESMAVLGRERCLRRIEEGVERLAPGGK
jgi:glutamyl-tRNA synthetase